MTFQIRLATAGDAIDILRIYEPFVRDTAITFETEVPSVDEFAQRIKGIRRRYPYLVCCLDGVIVGYAYASRHRERQAYDYDVDVSIYVSPQYHGTGAAELLYQKLFRILTELGYCHAYAGYTVPNEKSRKFHEKFGFTPVGTYRSTGYKRGSWHDVAWLEKSVNPCVDNPPAVQRIGDIPLERLLDILRSSVWEK